MFTKDFKHDVSKQMFARWQANLAQFDFEIQYKKGEDNSLPDFLTREYLQEWILGDEEEVQTPLIEEEETL